MSALLLLVIAVSMFSFLLHQKNPALLMDTPSDCLSQHHSLVTYQSPGHLSSLIAGSTLFSLSFSPPLMSQPIAVARIKHNSLGCFQTIISHGQVRALFGDTRQSQDMLWNLFYQRINPIHENSTIHIIISPKPHLLIPSTSGVRISVCEHKYA